MVIWIISDISLFKMPISFYMYEYIGLYWSPIIIRIDYQNNIGHLYSLQAYKFIFKILLMNLKVLSDNSNDNFYTFCPKNSYNSIV